MMRSITDYFTEREKIFVIIFGKPLSEYIAFAREFLILVPVIGIARLFLSVNGASNHTARWFSMTVIALIGVVVFSIRVHTTGFGSYKQLLALCALQNLEMQAISITGIVLAIITNTNNIFSSPEFFNGIDGKTWLHVGAHVVVGTTAGALLPWLFGSVILAITRKAVRN